MVVLEQAGDCATFPFPEAENEITRQGADYEADCSGIAMRGISDEQGGIPGLRRWYSGMTAADLSVFLAKAV